MKIKEILEEIEQSYPLSLQETWDNSGLQVGDIHQELTGILVAIDPTEGVVREAIAHGLNLLITHHPLLFHPLKQITPQTYIERGVALALQHGIVIYAAHTNLDNAIGGVNHYWAEQMGLQNTSVLAPLAQHNSMSIGSGIIGDLPSPISLPELFSKMKGWQPIIQIAHSKILKQEVKRVAYCGGSGSFLMEHAAAQGADVFITGEAKYNDFYDAQDLITLVTIGHFESEILTKEILFNRLSRKSGNFAVQLSTRCENPITYC